MRGNKDHIKDKLLLLLNTFFCLKTGIEDKSQKNANIKSSEVVTLPHSIQNKKTICLALHFTSGCFVHVQYD